MTNTFSALSGDLSRKGWLDRLAITLALFKDFISIQKGAAHLDSSKLAEGLVKDLLNLLGPWGAFKTLDHEYTNHPAIDLLSLDGDVGVQVTSSSSLTKVTETIEKFHRLNVPPKQLYILMICGRAKSYGKRSIEKALGNSTTKFDPDSNILTLPDIYRFAEQKSVGQVSKAVHRLEEELSSRALQLLQRFNASADRVLQVITAHEVSPAAVIELLGLDSSTEVDAIYSAHSLQPLLKPIAYEAIAAAFNVPVKWLNGQHDQLADRYGSSEWRSEGCVSGLISQLLSVYKSVHFKIVLPINPDGTIEDTNTPVLVFFEARNKYGKVYGHLGIQPWNIDHHSKAALYLGTIVRHLSLTEGLPIGVSWWQWPRNRIMATTTELLLAEAVQQEPRIHLDETQFIDYEKGKWHFTMNPALDEDFNKSFAPAVRDHVVRSREQSRRKDYVDELLSELVSKCMLRPPKKQVARVFGREAFAIAKRCRKKLSVVDGNGTVTRVSVKSAQKLIDESSVGVEIGKVGRMVFIDVRVA